MCVPSIPNTASVAEVDESRVKLKNQRGDAECMTNPG